MTRLLPKGSSLHRNQGVDRTPRLPPLSPLGNKPLQRGAAPLVEARYRWPLEKARRYETGATSWPRRHIKLKKLTRFGILTATSPADDRHEVRARLRAVTRRGFFAGAGPQLEAQGGRAPSADRGQRFSRLGRTVPDVLPLMVMVRPAGAGLGTDCKPCCPEQPMKAEHAKASKAMRLSFTGDARGCS